MHSSKLLLLPLLMVALQTPLHAEQFILPTVSVESVSKEEIPYALPDVAIISSDTGDLIKRLPGANINNNGPLTSIVQYRGLFGDRVNVLIDGVRINQAGPNRMDSPLSYLASSRVDNVALFRGIAPVSSGIETIGGTIMANSKHLDFTAGDEFEFHGNASSAYAENGHTRRAGITAGLANKNHRFEVAGSADRGDDLEFDGGKINPSRHQRDTSGLNYAFQQSGNIVEFDVEHHDTGETGTAALPMDIIFARGENYKTKFSKALANGGQVNVRFTIQDAEHLMNNTTLRTTATIRQRFTLTDVKSQGYHLSYNQNNTLIGIDIDQAEHNATVFNPNNASFRLDNYKDVKRDRSSLFTEWTGAISNKWRLKSGVRYTHVSMNADPVISTVAATTVLRTRFNNADRKQTNDLLDLATVFTHEITEEVDFEVGFARKERAPSYQERYLWATMQSTSGLADGNNYVGDVNLDPETAYQTELGLDWHTAKAGFSPRVFYHHINDYIQGVSTSDRATLMLSTMMGDTTPLQYSNVDAKLYGFDANWYAGITDTWQLDGTVSYVRGQRRDTADKLYRISPLTARTLLGYVKPDWHIGIEAVTVAAQNSISTENEEQKTAGYALFNLSGQYQTTENSSVTAGLNNLFDRYYQNHLGGINRISDNPNIALGERLLGVGRSAYVSININW